jgi:hypothetical protein
MMKQKKHEKTIDPSLCLTAKTAGTVPKEVRCDRCLGSPSLTRRPNQEDLVVVLLKGLTTLPVTSNEGVNSSFTEFTEFIESAKASPNSKPLTSHQSKQTLGEIWKLPKDLRTLSIWLSLRRYSPLTLHRRKPNKANRRSAALRPGPLGMRPTSQRAAALQQPLRVHAQHAAIQVTRCHKASCHVLP